MQQQLTVRQAEYADWQSLVNFNQAMAQETESKSLDQVILTKGVQSLLNDPDKGFYLVAVNQHGELAGSLMVTFEWSDWRNATFWWIQSVYVIPEARRTGVYSALYEKVKSLGEGAENVCGFRLYVEKENLTAQSAYEKLGMHESHYLMYESDE